MKNETSEKIQAPVRKTRRDFLQSTAAVGAGLIFSPMITAQENNAEKPDNINVALLGAGAQGQLLMNACRDIPGVSFKAVCDIWADYNRQRMARILRAYKHDVNEYEDYRQMLSEEKDLDAVIIATPDFLHAEQTIACLNADLHVYCESEMSNTIEGAKQMVLTAKQTGKLLQIGRQRRSNPRYIHCYEKLIREYGLFGQFVAVNGQWNRNVYEPLGWPQNATLPDAKLNKYGYQTMEQFRNWRWFKGLGSGLVTDLGSHQIDVYNWFLNGVPKNVSAVGVTNFYGKYFFEWYDSVMLIYEYETSRGTASAFYQAITGNRSGRVFEKFLSDQGTLIISEYASWDGIYLEPTSANLNKWRECINKGDLTASKEILQEIHSRPDSFLNIFVVDESPPGQKPRRLNIPVTMSGKGYHQHHLENFFDAIRGRAQLNCPAKIGYKTTVTVLKANEAIETGKRLEFKSDEFIV